MKTTTQPSEAVRTLVSLAVFIHLFCLAVVLTSSFSQSPLQQRLVSLFSPYTQTLHLDPNYLPPIRRLPATPPSAFHLTTGEADTRLHQWLLTTADGATTYRFPDSQWRASFTRRRLDMLGRIGGYYAGLEIDEVPAELAQGLVRCALNRMDRAVEEASQPIYVRCVEHVGDGDPSTFDPTAPDAGVNTLYEADVWMEAAESGPPTVNVLKRSPASQSAPPQRSELP